MRHKQDMRAAGCLAEDTATSFCLGHLAPETRTACERHLVACPACAARIADMRKAIEALRAIPPAQVGSDLTPAILDRLAAEEAWQRRAWRWAAAAGVAVLVGGSLLAWMAPKGRWLSTREGRDTLALSGRPEKAQDAAADWFCRAQEDNGSWDAAKWGGDRRYDVALTALTTLALLEAPSAPERNAAVRKAVAYLLKRQDATGLFGPSFDGAPYNHGMATLALLRVLRATGDVRLQEPLDRAVARITARQTREGGWGYWGEVESEPNLSVTWWQTEALKMAETLGWQKVSGPLRRATRWVASLADETGAFGYRRAADTPPSANSLTPMGATMILAGLPPISAERIKALLLEMAAKTPIEEDYYRTYFLMRALRNMPDEEAGQARLALRRELVERQVATAPVRGSWEPDRRWGAVGGRVYATALASLSL